MQSLSKYNKENKYLCVIDLFSKYAWVIPINDKKGVSIVNASQEIISEGKKPNKISVNQGSEFHNNYFKDFLKTNKSVVAERFIRTLRNKIFKHLTAILKKCLFSYVRSYC